MQHKTRIRDIYYLYHPNAIQDDTNPKGYRIIGGGKWVVEWDIFTLPIKLSSEPQHFTKSFNSEADAQVFYKKLMKRYEKQELRKG